MEKTEIKKICLYCGKELIINIKPKKFCNDKCRYNYKYANDIDFLNRKKEIAQNTYQKLKDNPEYKKMKVEIFKKWLQNPENRKKFNDKMRITNRLRQRKIHSERLEKKLCTICGGNRDTEKKSCSYCLERKRLERARRLKKLKGGMNE